MVSHSGQFSYILDKHEYFLNENHVESKPINFLVKDKNIDKCYENYSKSFEWYIVRFTAEFVQVSYKMIIVSNFIIFLLWKADRLW